MTSLGLLSLYQSSSKKMNITPKRVVRFILGALLPVPLFVGIYYFSYFYTSYKGFDHESQLYMTSPSEVSISRQHIKTDALVFLAMGYFLMGIPSIVYSFVLERCRVSQSFKLRSYLLLGVLMGCVAGVIATTCNFVLTDGFFDRMYAIGISTIIGGAIPALLALIPNLQREP